MLLAADSLVSERVGAGAALVKEADTTVMRAPPRSRHRIRTRVPVNQPRGRAAVDHRTPQGSTANRPAYLLVRGTGVADVADRLNLVPARTKSFRLKAGFGAKSAQFLTRRGDGERLCATSADNCRSLIRKGDRRALARVSCRRIQFCCLSFSW
jgi:hypothetical protein